MRISETWAAWALGLVVGAAVGFLLFTPFVILTLLIVPAGSVIARGLGYLSGIFIGWSLAWSVVLAWPNLIGSAWSPSIVYTGGVILLGLIGTALGAGAVVRLRGYIG